METVKKINTNYEELKNNHLGHIERRLDKVEENQVGHTKMLEAISFNVEQVFSKLNAQSKLSGRIK